MRNLLLTNMSTLPNTPKRSEYCGEFTNEQGNNEFRYCHGIGQLEAGTKYFLSKVKIDRIIVIGTEATAKRTHVCLKNSEDGIPKLKSALENGREDKEIFSVVNGNDDEGISADEFYVKQILQFVQGGESLANLQGQDAEPSMQEKNSCTQGANPSTQEEKLSMVPLAENRGLCAEDFIVIKDVAKPNENAEFAVDNVQGIVNTILSESPKEEICLYIDMQGGIRTSGYVRNAVLSILGNEKDSRVKIKEIIATEYGTHNQVNRIVNETKRYKIMDLAAAMNSFVRYGKVDLLKTYCEERGITVVRDGAAEGDGAALGRLLGLMEKVDDSISLCNINGLQEAIAGMKTLFDEEDALFNAYGEEQTDDQVFVKSMFEILKEGIRRDYGALLTTTEDKYTLELIHWCTRKGFLQQALTLVEDQMPKVFLKKEQDVTDNKYILKYRETNGNELKEFGELIGHSYYEEENNLFYSLERYLRQGGWFGSVYKRVIASTNPSGPKPFDRGDSINKNNVPIGSVIGDILALNGLNLNDESMILQEEDLQEIARNILNKNNQEFIDSYCQFRICNNELEANKVSAMDVRSIYYKIKQAGYGFHYKPYMTLVHNADDSDMGNGKKYRIQKPGVNEERYVKISINPEDSQRKRKLDDLLLLHGALKMERNCANHASNKGVRLSAGIVKRALEIYVKEAEEFVNGGE